MRDIFRRQRRCAMFLSYASNDWENTGTRYACETIRSGFEEAALCSVWMDRVDACHTVSWKELVREGLQAANVYIVCLTPLYLTRPNCLTELNDILMLVKASRSKPKCQKRLIVLPLHPIMTSRGRQRILQCRFVFLPDFKDSSFIRKHALSDVSLSLLKELALHDRGEADPITRWRDPDLEQHMWLVKFRRSPIFENL